LTQLPDIGVGNLVSLMNLDVSNNQLTQLPESIGKLTNLRQLLLNNNQLTQLPESISELTRLGTLNLSNNQLTQLPRNIDGLTGLTKLNLSNNQFTEWPENIGYLEKLLNLDVSNNQLTEISEEGFKFESLITLNLSNNQLRRLPGNFSGLNSLQDLNVSNNPLTTLPNLIRLRILDINNTNIVIDDLPLRLRDIVRPLPIIIRRPNNQAEQANEIHNAFRKINIKKYMEIIEEQTPQSPDYAIQSKEEFLTGIYNRIKSFTKEPPQIQKLDNLFATLRMCSLFNDNNMKEYGFSKQMIGRTLDFVFQQPPMFIETYVTNWINDNASAYDSGHPSCVDGMKERFVTLIADSILTYCSIAETITHSEETKEEKDLQEEKSSEPTPEPNRCAEGSVYDQLLLVLNKKIDKNELTQEWATKMEREADSYRSMSVQERKKNYIDFMTQKYKTFYETSTLDPEIVQLIQTEADKFDYVFEQDEAQFGGRRRRRPRRQTRRRHPLRR
jgi:hypothetical protein